jgi:hypothetical protein
MCIYIYINIYESIDLYNYTYIYICCTSIPAPPPEVLIASIAAAQNLDFTNRGKASNANILRVVSFSALYKWIDM